MLRRCLLLLTLLLVPLAVLAEDFVPYEVFTFSGSLPERLKEPLSTLITDESRILSSAAIKSNGGDYADDWYAALILVDATEGARLRAAAEPEGLPWQVEDFTHLLRSRQDVSVSIYMDEYTRVPRLSVDYHVQGELISDLITFSDLWEITGHTDTARGMTVAVTSRGIEITDRQGYLECQAAQPFFLEYMDDIAALPVTRVEALAQEARAESAVIASSLKAIMYAAGAHLRTGPTGSANSLGQYNTDVPMVYLGKQEKGAQWPWYQVRIGETVGWMSSNYIHTEPQHRAVPMGRNIYGCTLYAAADETQPIVRLLAGTTFHILTEYKGMYHICIPRGEISWAVDADGTYGYIPMVNVLTGASPSALDALAR